MASKSRPENPTEASEPSPVLAIATVLRMLKETLSAAGAELANAEAAVQTCETAAGAAKVAHDAAPTDSAAAAEQMTGVALARAMRVCNAARTRVATSLADVGNAETKLADARREVRRAELREASSAATLAARIEKPWADLIACSGRPSELAEMIRSAYASSLAASHELRSSFGEAVFDLDRVHAILPALRNLADRGHVVNGVLENSEARRVPLTGASLVGLLDGAHSRVMPADHVRSFRARLARFAATRTWHEAAALEKAEDEAAQAAREASPEGQELARRMAEHNERTKQPRFRPYQS